MSEKHSKDQHYFQSQRTEDSAHLGSVHDHTSAKAPKHGQRHAATPSHDEIAKHAYALFAESGYISGHDVDHWLQAEAKLRAA